MVINELQVLMNNVPVRRLSKNQLGLMSFVYDASWLEHPARRPISLSLPLSPNPYKCWRTGWLLHKCARKNWTLAASNAHDFGA